MLSKAKLIELGIVAVSVLVILALMKIIDLVVASFLLAATIGVIGWVLNYMTKPTK